MPGLASARSIFEQNIQKNKEAGCDKNILGQKASSNPSRVVTRRLFAHNKLSDDSNNHSNNNNMNEGPLNFTSLGGAVAQERRRSSVSSVSSTASASSSASSTAAAIIQARSRRSSQSSQPPPQQQQQQQSKGQTTVEQRRTIRTELKPPTLLENQESNYAVRSPPGAANHEKISKNFPFKDVKKRSSIKNLADHLGKLEIKSLQGRGPGAVGGESELNSSRSSLEAHRDHFKLPDFRQSSYVRSNTTGRINHQRRANNNDQSGEAIPDDSMSSLGDLDISNSNLQGSSSSLSLSPTGTRQGPEGSLDDSSSHIRLKRSSSRRTATERLSTSNSSGTRSPPLEISPPSVRNKLSKQLSSRGNISKNNKSLAAHFAANAAKGAWIQRSSVTEDDDSCSSSHHSQPFKAVPFTKSVIKRHQSKNTTSSSTTNTSGSRRESTMSNGSSSSANRRESTTVSRRNSTRNLMGNGSGRRNSSRNLMSNNSGRREGGGTTVSRRDSKRNVMRDSSSGRRREGSTSRRNSNRSLNGSSSNNGGSLHDKRSGSSHKRNGSSHKRSSSSRRRGSMSSTKSSKSTRSSSKQRPRRPLPPPKPDAHELELQAEIEALQKQIQESEAKIVQIEEGEKFDLKRVQETKERKLRRIENSEKRKPPSSHQQPPSSLKVALAKSEDDKQVKLASRQLKHENAKLHDEIRKMKVENASTRSCNRLLRDSTAEIKGFLTELKAQQRRNKQEHDQLMKLIATHQQSMLDVEEAIEKKSPAVRRLKSARLQMEDKIDIIVAFMQKKCSDFDLVEELTILAGFDESGWEDAETSEDDDEEYDSEEDRRTSYIQTHYGNNKAIESDDESPRSVADLLIPTSSHSLHLFVE